MADAQAAAPAVPQAKDWAAIAESWPANNIEKWELGRLLPYAQNPKTHTREQVELIKALIVHYGWTTPCLVDETGLLIAGHGRVIAASELGIVRVPVIVARGWSEADKRAYRIADNASADPSWAPWNPALLKIEITDLGSMNFPLAMLAFPAVQLEEFRTWEPAQAPTQESVNRALAEQFGVPPFTVLNARAGWWQMRKAAWIGLGMQPELGRGEMTNRGQDSSKTQGNLAGAANFQRAHAAQT